MYDLAPLPPNLVIQEQFNQGPKSACDRLYLQFALDVIDLDVQFADL